MSGWTYFGIAFGVWAYVCMRDRPSWRYVLTAALWPVLIGEALAIASGGLKSKADHEANKKLKAMGKP
jgi:ABC-type uncharacterized transport system permease subunit